MHDIRAIRDNPATFDAGLARRGLAPHSAEILALDEKRRALSTELQGMQTRRNEASKAIGQAKAKKDEATASALMAEVATIKERMPALEADEQECGTALDTILAALPNIPAEDVPEGADEDANVEVGQWGTPGSFDFTPQEHADIGPALGLDFESAAAIAGAQSAAADDGRAKKPDDNSSGSSRDNPESRMEKGASRREAATIAHRDR